jgi:hypothetical protein
MFTRSIEALRHSAERLSALFQMPAARSRAAWMTSIGGFRGPQALQMEIYRLGEALPSGPGVFIFAGHNTRRWTALYAGETIDLRTRAPGHETLPEALLLGATHVHIARIDDPNTRRSAAERLVFMYGPPMNAASAPLLSELIQAGHHPAPEPQDTPRLAIAG